MQPTLLTLIVTTYNWPEALELVLLSIKKQLILPDEVIIADDGSTIATQDMISQYQRNFPVPLIHSWQEDQGFRLARSRNQAIAKAKGDYIVMIDGDMILQRNFIQDHKRIAKPHQFVQGRRVILTENISQDAVTNKNICFSFFSSEVKNKINSLHCPLLSPIISTLFSKQSYHSVRGCNMAMWKNDLIAVNGFNEDFVGWGREDSEFVLRMLNNGIKRKDLRLGGIAYHLFHHENPRQNLDKNDRLLEEAVKNHITYCQHGLANHL